MIVEDVSLGFEELGNFPGPYVRWLLEAAGGTGLAAIAYALNNRAAKAQCCVGYWDGSTIRMFLGETAGEILVTPRGERHFGWDAWFQPAGQQKVARIAVGDLHHFAAATEIAVGQHAHRRSLRITIASTPDGW